MNKATLHITGIIGQDITLIDVIRQYKAYDSPDSVEVIIDSPGGSVDVGQSIYSYLRNLGIPVKTVAKTAYSISASIFMAGDQRVVEEGEERLMIHLPFAQKVSGNSSDLQAYSDHLKEIEKGFVDFYAAYLDLDKETIMALLEKNTFLSASEALEMGFATEIATPLKAVAFYIKPIEKMNLKEAITLITKKLNLNTMDLVLQSTDGTELDFPELSEGDQPKVDDKAQIDGSPANGDYVMADGRTLVIVDGVVTEVKEEETEAPEVVAESQIAEVSKWELSVVEDTFEVGVTLHYLPYEDEEPTTVSAGEYELEDQRKILVDADGIIQFIKPAPVAEDAEVVALLKAFEKRFTDQEAEIMALKKLVSTPEMEVEPTNPKSNTNYTNYLK